MSYFLIADDSASKMHMLVSFVEHAKLDVELLTAASTEAAKQLIDQHPDIAAAFIDYEMPSELGPAVISYLREKNPSALIACVSSAGNDHYRNTAKDAGANAYICTSYDIDQVKEQIFSLLEEWRVEME